MAQPETMCQIVPFCATQAKAKADVPVPGLGGATFATFCNVFRNFSDAPADGGTADACAATVVMLQDVTTSYTFEGWPLTQDAWR
jgi:hypothetical protein